MNFDPTTWGTVADWVGGVGTTAAFLITALVVYRDAKVRRSAQAQQVAYIVRKPDDFIHAMLQGKDVPVDYIVSNMSPEPIYDVIQFNRTDGLELITYAEVLLPGKEIELAKGQFDRIDPPLISFRDNSGNHWIRSAAGYVHPTGKRWHKQNLPADFNNTKQGLLLW